MIIRNSMILAMGVLLAFFVSGCAGYGKIVPESVPGQRMTVDTLERDWQQYEVYSAPMDAAIIFAPKGDPNAIELSSHWTKLTEKSAVASTVGNIETQPVLMGLYRPTLYVIRGQNGGFYGYMFTAWDQLQPVLKQVGPNSLSIYGITQPPYLQFEGGGSRDNDPEQEK
jgi:hypothetical protein